VTRIVDDTAPDFPNAKGGALLGRRAGPP